MERRKRKSLGLVLVEACEFMIRRSRISITKRNVGVRVGGIWELERSLERDWPHLSCALNVDMHSPPARLELKENRKEKKRKEKNDGRGREVQG